ncbi:MAG: aminotransferase class V-fold PLP-dependent enzyme, partial [Actinobacteria bacterium]|nr:aminotransferase class V-fold PLP-dependent enzyme [Actinomycetota bacterium]
MENKIFFDNASTTRVDDRVYEEMEPYFKTYYGNPSSLHEFGEKASEKLEESRQKVADLIGATAEEIYFTSCGTESNNFALWGIARAYREKGNHIISSVIEHHSILNPLKEMQKEGWNVTLVPVDENGFINPEDVKKAITKETVLITIMHANNEIGTIQNIRDISKIAKESNTVFHSDGVATAGIIPVDVNEEGIDAYTFSSQQMYGPKGAAALYLRKGIKIRPLLLGGTQERGRRAGTENVPAIVGFGKACEISKMEIPSHMESLVDLRDNLINGIMEKIEKVKLNGHHTLRLSGNVHMSYEYVEGESILLMLNLQGIAAASGSSCTSQALKSSHVLIAINLSP